MSPAPTSTPVRPADGADRAAVPLMGVLTVLLAATLFGTLGPISRLAYEAGMAPEAWVAWRAAIGGTALAAFVTWRVRTGRTRLIRPREVSRSARLSLLLAALMAFTLNQSMFVAFDRITIALAVLTFYSYPALTAIANVALGRERLERTRTVALALALAGMVAVVASEIDPSRGVRVDAIGIGLAAGAALSQTVFVLVSRDGYRVIPTEQAMGLILVLTAIASSLLALAVGGVASMTFPIAQPTLLPLLVAVGVFTSAIPSLLFLGGVRSIGGVRAGTLMLFEPVVAVLLAAWLLSEGLAWIQVVGASAILAAALLLQRGPRGSSAADEADGGAAPVGDRDGRRDAPDDLAIHVPGGP